jgi:protein TonB
MKSLTRTTLSLFGSGFISLSLFYLMSVLISGGTAPKKSDDGENFIEFVRIQRPTNTEVKKRELPKKEEPVKQESMKETFAANTQNEVVPNRAMPTFDTPKMDIPLANGPGGIAVNGGGTGSGGMKASGDHSETPLVRVDPMFPPEAAMKGIEKGWVRVQFNINTDGSVINVRIIESSHREVFDMAAKKAILKWRYRPKLIDGKPIVSGAQKVQLDFLNE